MERATLPYYLPIHPAVPADQAMADAMRPCRPIAIARSLTRRVRRAKSVRDKRRPK